MIIILLIILILFIIIIIKKNNKKEYFKNLSKNNWKNLKFTDKLKLYGLSLTKKNSFYVDKLRVKNYIDNLNIKDLYTPKTIKVLDKNKEELNLSKLPKKCVIKSNNSSGPIIIIKNSKIKLIQPKISYNKWIKKAIKPHITKYEKHYIDIEPEIFVEEYLGDNISDYKFFCLYGKVIIIQIDQERFISHRQNLYDRDLNLLPYIFKEKNSDLIKVPKNIKKMIYMAEKISKIFIFARIDLYDLNNKIYFGEITFVPEAGRTNFKPIKYDYKLGKLWKK